MESGIRLTPKSLQVLQLIAAGRSYAQIVDSHPELNYHDIFFAAEEALWLNEKLAGGIAVSPQKVSPSGSLNAMEKAKLEHPRAYAPWTESEDAELKNLSKLGQTNAQISRHLQRQPSAIRARLAKLQTNLS